MKIYNIYILTVASLFLLTAVILVALEETRVDLYYSLYVIEALITTELFLHLNPKARRGLTVVSTILVAAFLIFAFWQVFQLVRRV